MILVRLITREIISAAYSFPPSPLADNGEDMRHLLQCTLLVLLCQTLNAHDSDVEQWNADVKLIKEALVQTKQQDKEAVFADLEWWNPEHASKPWKMAMNFRDRYLFDDSITPLIRASFIPGVVGFFSNLFSSSVQLPSEEVVRLWYLGLESLKQVHKIPYYLDGGSLTNTYMNSENLASLLAIAAHSAALGAPEAVSLFYQSLGIEGVVALSTVFAGLAYWQSGESSEYLDIGLRSLKRSYEIKKEEQKLAVVLQAIGIRKGLKAKAS